MVLSLWRNKVEAGEGAQISFARYVLLYPALSIRFRGYHAFNQDTRKAAEGLQKMRCFNDAVPVVFDEGIDTEKFCSFEECVSDVELPEDLRISGQVL